MPVLDFLRVMFSGARRQGSTPAARARVTAPATLMLKGVAPFPIQQYLKLHNSYPVADWDAIEDWMKKSVPEKRHAEAWTECERAWLLHFREALGSRFQLDEGPTAIVLSSLEPRASALMVAYMERSIKRIGAVLRGLAHVPEWGKDLLIIFDDVKQYYDYVSYYYPEKGEFAFSGGMYIHSGCSHFVTIKDDLRAIEPTIVHEMTHGCLGHLPIPAWVNEGIAVNTEHRLAGSGRPLYTPEQMHHKHLRFWGTAEIQEFWSGKSFLRTDDGNMLSYDLARILVEQFSRDWDRFEAFALAANLDDGGSAAAMDHLEIALGTAVAALLEKEPTSEWEPDPAKWEGEAERGAFGPQ